MTTEVEKLTDKPEAGPDVSVSINGTSKTIHRGSWKVSALKDALGVGGASNFEEVLADGSFKPLTDDQRITIKGGEKFVTHGGGGGSSCDR